MSAGPAVARHLAYRAAPSARPTPPRRRAMWERLLDDEQALRLKALLFIVLQLVTAWWDGPLRP